MTLKIKVDEFNYSSKIEKNRFCLKSKYHLDSPCAQSPQKSVRWSSSLKISCPWSAQSAFPRVMKIITSQTLVSTPSMKSVSSLSNKQFFRWKDFLEWIVYCLTIVHLTRNSFAVVFGSRSHKSRKAQKLRVIISALETKWIYCSEPLARRFPAYVAIEGRKRFCCRLLGIQKAEKCLRSSEFSQGNHRKSLLSSFDDVTIGTFQQVGRNSSTNSSNMEVDSRWLE